MNKDELGHPLETLLARYRRLQAHVANMRQIGPDASATLRLHDEKSPLLFCDVGVPAEQWHAILQAAIDKESAELQEAERAIHRAINALPSKK